MVSGTRLLNKWTLQRDAFSAKFSFSQSPHVTLLCVLVASAFGSEQLRALSLHCSRFTYTTGLTMQTMNIKPAILAFVVVEMCFNKDYEGV